MSITATPSPRTPPKPGVQAGSLLTHNTSVTFRVSGLGKPLLFKRPDTLLTTELLPFCSHEAPDEVFVYQRYESQAGRALDRGKQQRGCLAVDRLLKNATITFSAGEKFRKTREVLYPRWWKSTSSHSIRQTSIF